MSDEELDNIATAVLSKVDEGASQDEIREFLLSQGLDEDELVDVMDAVNSLDEAEGMADADGVSDEDIDQLEKLLGAGDDETTAQNMANEDNTEVEITEEDTDSDGDIDKKTIEKKKPEDDSDSDNSSESEDKPHDSWTPSEGMLNSINRRF